MKTKYLAVFFLIGCEFPLTVNTKDASAKCQLNRSISIPSQSGDSTKVDSSYTCKIDTTAR